jgi:hypothetical protein
MVAELRACVNALVDEIFGGVTAAERDLFVRVMQTLRGNLGMRREIAVAAND